MHSVAIATDGVLGLAMACGVARLLVRKGGENMAVDPRSSPFWPADSPGATTHITLLQGIITRLANNSASCKTWCLTLVAALLSLSGAAHLPQMVTATLVPILIFGFLDVMYLATEVVYRNLYTQIVDAMRGDRYGKPMMFEAKAGPDAGCVIWALGSWSIILVLRATDILCDRRIGRLASASGANHWVNRCPRPTRAPGQVDCTGRAIDVALTVWCVGPEAPHSRAPCRAGVVHVDHITRRLWLNGQPFRRRR